MLQNKVGDLVYIPTGVVVFKDNPNNWIETDEPRYAIVMDISSTGQYSVLWNGEIWWIDIENTYQVPETFTST